VKARWEVQPLGDVATFVMGQAPAGSDCNKEGIGTPFVKAGEFGERRPIIREWTTDPKKFATETDVLICVVGATCGKINLGADCAIGRSAAAIRPKPGKLDQFYLHYYLEGQVQKFRAGSVGAAQTVISRDMLSEMPIPLPPLEEQQRIVAALDEAFEGLTRARAHAEANLHNARELFRRYVEVEYARLALLQPRRTIGQIAAIKGGKRLPKGDKLVSTKTPFPYISIKDFNELGSIDLATIDYLLPETRDAIKNYIIRSEDLYISIAGTIGKTGIVPSELDGANLTENAARMVFSEGINNEYVYYFTLTDDFQDQAGLNTRTAAQPKLALERLKTISLPIAPLTQQLEMADRFRTMREQSQIVQASYRTKLNGLDALRQSLLQKAFAGELT
jgi:type I restriction enzyme, S subunit